MGARAKSIWKKVAPYFTSTTAAWATALTAFIMAWWTVNSTERAIQAERKVDWQKAIVFSIIQERYLSNNVPVSLADITHHYEQKVAADAAITRKYSLTKDDLDSITLQKLLIDLASANQIYQVHPGGKYAIQLIVPNPRLPRSFQENEIKYTVLNILTTEAGRYTVQDIDQRVQQTLGAKSEEYNFVINQLLSTGMITVAFDKADKTRKVLYTAANCPTCPHVYMEPPALVPLPPDAQKAKPAGPKKDINWNLGGT